MYLAIWQNSHMRNQPSYEHYAKRAQVIKAMAHPSRLIMLDALSEGDLCVCELQELIGSDMSTVSKHLSLLKNAGLVKDRKVGLKVIFSLRVPCLNQFFNCVETVLNNQSLELTASVHSPRHNKPNEAMK